MINQDDRRAKEIARQGKRAGQGPRQLATSSAAGVITPSVGTFRTAEGKSMNMFIINSTQINADGYYFGSEPLDE